MCGAQERVVNRSGYVFQRQNMAASSFCRWRSLEQQLEKQSADSTRLLQAAAEICTLAKDSIAPKYNAVAKLEKAEVRLAEQQLQLQQSLENNEALTSQFLIPVIVSIRRRVPPRC